MEEKDFNTEENIEISEKDYDNTDKKKSAGRELLEWVQAIVIVEYSDFTFDVYEDDPIFDDYVCPGSVSVPTGYRVITIPMTYEDNIMK